MDPKEILLEHRGEHFLATVDEELYKKIIDDSEKKLECFKFVQEHVIEQGTRVAEDYCSASSASKWTSNSIRLLLTERLSKEEEFNRPTCRKQKLWQAISKILEEKTGCPFDANSCDIKYRNMLSTYRNNKKRQQQIGESAINWEYFQIFDKVLGQKASSVPPDNTLGDSLVLAGEDSLVTSASKWTSSSIKLLITERLSKEEEFNRPTCSKRKLWEAISQILEEKIGGSFDANSCDIKYRNLISTYRNNKKRQQQSGEGSINWEYFQLFDKVLGHKASSVPSDHILDDPLAMTKRPASLPASSSSSAESSDEDIYLQGATKKKRNKLSIPDYLTIKLKRDMEYKKEQLEHKKQLLEHRKKQLELKKKIWEEKKMLKEKEIEAIIQLSKAMIEKKIGK